MRIICLENSRPTRSWVKRWMLWVFTACLLAGCAGFSELATKEGDTLSLSGRKLVYTRVNSEPERCFYLDPISAWMCADSGVISKLTTARLPLSFHGVLLANFDGKRFYAKKIPKKRGNFDCTENTLAPS